MIEEWRPVPDYEGLYEVSNLGRFRSIDRWVDFADGRRRFFAGRDLKLKINRDGYPLVLFSAGMARKAWRLAHTVVARAFLGPCPEGLETCHKDGVHAHISVDNLRYGTRVSNHSDKMLHGTSNFGATHHAAHLAQDVVADIRAAKGTITEIADRFGVSRTHAWNIRARKRRHSLSEMLS